MSTFDPHVHCYPELLARWKKEDVVLTEAHGARGMGDKLAWYNNPD